MRKRINRGFISFLLRPLCGTADDDEFFEMYKNFDTDDEVDCKEIIKRELLPYYKETRDEKRIKMLDALHYALSDPDFDFDRALSGEFHGLNSPTDFRMFFVWLWDVITDDQPFVPYNLNEIEVYYDEEEVLLAQFVTPPDNWEELLYPGRDKSEPPEPYPPIVDFNAKPHMIQKISVCAETPTSRSPREGSGRNLVSRIVSSIRTRFPLGRSESGDSPD